MPKQISGKPTQKVIAGSVASFLAAALVSLLASKGLDLSADDVAHVNALIESAAFGLIGLVMTFVASYFKSPSASDGVTS